MHILPILFQLIHKIDPNLLLTIYTTMLSLLSMHSLSPFATGDGDLAAGGEGDEQQGDRVSSWHQPPDREEPHHCDSEQAGCGGPDAGGCLRPEAGLGAAPLGF